MQTDGNDLIMRDRQLKLELMPKQYTTPVIEVQKKHVTIRAFTGQPLEDEMLDAILEAARRSPTSSNRQTYSIVVVRNPETRKKLAVLAGNQQHIVECGAFVAYCADISRMEVACEMHGVTLNKGLELTMVASIDAALVGMSAQTAAESFGLGAVMVGAMRNDPLEAARLLGLPKGVYVVFGMSIGWPDHDNYPAQKPRLPRDLIIHRERYDQSDPREQMAQYDIDLAEHYGDRNQFESAWTGPIAKQIQNPRRDFLSGALKKLGFSLD